MVTILNGGASNAGEVWASNAKGLVESVNAYQDGSRTLRLPAGTFTESDILSVASGGKLVVQGAGMHLTKIKAGAVIAEILHYAGAGVIELRDLCFDGDGKANYGLLLDGAYTTDDDEMPAYSMIVERCKFINTIHQGIKFNSPAPKVDRAVVDKCYFYRTAGCIYGNITDSLFSGNISNYQIDDAADGYLASIIVFRSANRIINNYWGGGAKHGIYIWASAGTIVSGNIVDHYLRHGIVIRGGFSTENAILGGKVTTCGRETSNTYDGIRLEADSGAAYPSYNTISGVTIQTDAAPTDLKYGINEVAGGDYNRFGTVTLRGTFGTAAKNITGANSKDDV